MRRAGAILGTVLVPLASLITAGAALPVRAAAADVTVTISNFTYMPAFATITKGRTIAWSNTDPLDHTATSDTGLWNTGAIPSGQTSAPITISLSPGTYLYHCTIHPFMHGTLVVQAASPPPPVAVLPSLANGAFGGYTTAVYLTNTNTAGASVSLEYFDTGGSPAGAGDSTMLAPHATWIVRQDNGHAFSAGGAGSAVIRSDRPIAAFVNEFPPLGIGDGTSYTSIPLGASASTVYAPAIANGAFGGYTTGIGLFNAGSSSTEVTITYRGADGTVVRSQTLTGVAGHAYQPIYSGDSGQPTDANLPAGFAGTATITSTQPLAAVVNELGPGGQFSSYDAVVGGNTTLQAPAALNNAFGGFFTGFGIQNTTGTGGTVTVTYYDASGIPTARSFAIAANGYLPVYQGDPSQGPAPGAYTATISSTVPVAAEVNEVAPAGPGTALQSTSYNTFAGGASAVNLALVESAGADGWSTGLGIMNTGSSATTVTVNYFDVVSGSPVGMAQSRTLQPRAFWGLYQPTGGLPNGQRASAQVTTTAATVAVICNESNVTTFMSYDGQ